MTKKQRKSLVNKILVLAKEHPEGWKYYHSYSVQYPVLRNNAGFRETVCVKVTFLESWSSFLIMTPCIEYFESTMIIPYFSFDRFKLFFAFRKIWKRIQKEQQELLEAKERENLERLNNMWSQN